ncbi:CAP-Gly protein [Hafnia paralvei]|uniref:CAP-Gly protein n=1 Tax=Hafnia paralvei TaxID=546367 RepID=UPI00300C0B00
MELTNRVGQLKSASWGGIWAGSLSVLAISILMSTLGAALGFSMIEPLSGDPMDGVATSVLVWYVFSAIISLAVGGYIAGRLAGIDGAIHGFLVWSTALIIAAVLGSLILGSAIKTTGNVLGSVASATGNAAYSASSMLGNDVSSLAKSGSEIFHNIDINTNLKQQGMTSNLTDLIKKSGIESLQPEYIDEQMNGAKDDISEAINEIVVSPKDNDIIINKLKNKLKTRVNALTKDVDRTSLTNAISKNSDLTPDEVNQAVTNIISAKNKASEVINQRFTDAEQKIDEAKKNYAELKKQARESADRAAEMAAKISLASFFALLLGALVSTFAGFFGAKTSLHFTKQ